jgi:hypothetical protein
MRYPYAVMPASRLMLAFAILVAGLLVGCRELPADCRIGDADSGQLSTRVLFLERLKGCPVGGRG